MKDVIKKYRNNHLTSEEVRELRERLESTANQQIEEAIYDDWSDFEPAPSENDLETERRVFERISPTLHNDSPKNAWSVIRIITSVAAVIIIGLLSYSTYYFYTSTYEVSAQRFSASTSAWERADILLPEGSLVKLNQMSEINYTAGDFSGKTRNVEFNGEGYFDVSKIPHRPFRITTSELEIVVKGTSFNLMARKEEDKAVLSLIDGAVELTYRKTGETVTLCQSEKATVNYAAGDIEVSRIGENDNTLAWKLGRLTFVNAGYDEVIEQLRSHYGDKLPPITKREYNERFTGMIPLDNVNVAMEIVSTTFPDTDY